MVIAGVRHFTVRWLGEGPGGDSFGEMERKSENRRDPHIYELFFKIGCVCSNFRNENFKYF